MQNQFLVPQFLDVEDKIFGPITTRQFVILLSGSLLVFISFKLADTMLFIFLLSLFGGFSLVLAFVKINGQTFHYFLLNIIQNFKSPSRRIWRKDYTKAQLDELRKSEKRELIEKTNVHKKISYNRIRDLSLIVNTGGYYKAE